MLGTCGTSRNTCEDSDMRIHHWLIFTLPDKGFHLRDSAMILLCREDSSAASSVSGTRWFGIQRQSETRAGKLPNAYTRITEASPSTRG